MTRHLPRTDPLDHTLSFLREGYTFISRRCEQMHTDAFRTRLLLRPVVCMRGEDAAALFYRHDAFTRRGAVPPTTLRLLQGAGSVQTLDGAAHMLRRHLFLSLLNREGSHALVSEFERLWTERSRQWRKGARVSIDEFLPELLAEACLHWLGLDPEREGFLHRAEEAKAMVLGAGSVGPKLVRGLWQRRRSERWAERLIQDLRAWPRDESRAMHVAHARDEYGHLLPVNIAAFELINLLRPVVAVWVFGVFVALSLHRFPRYRDWLAEWDDPRRVRAFVHEVRRYWPFFPAIGGVALRDLIWRDTLLPEGTWVLLDLYGTNHHPGIWQHPHLFRPERFLEQAPGMNELVAQGGGHIRRSHRCPGEDVTVLLLERVARHLAALRWHAQPGQDLSLDLSHAPALPRHGMTLEVEEPPRAVIQPLVHPATGSSPASGRLRH